MSSMYDRLRTAGWSRSPPWRALVLAAAACSSNSASSNGAAGSGGKVTISIDCAPPAAQHPVQHKEWLEDVAIFEKANPNITINSVYNYPCDANRRSSPRCCGRGPSRTSSTPTSPTCRRCCSRARPPTSPST